MLRKEIIGIAVSAVFLLMTSCRDNKSKNHLSGASSPYLQEHADNPVAWYEWGDEALKKAKDENKPIIVSIGYASCHWCHVMEKESFMDTAVARIMNENFICIKVDREERPDIDNIYVNACQLLNGNAGWPLNAFALPDGKPFYAGTYYSKSGWIALLNDVAKAWKEKKELVFKQAEGLTNGIAEQELQFFGKDSAATFVNKKSYQALFENIYSNMDIRNGGLKRAPKFPMPSLTEFLLQYYYYTGDKKALDAATVTLNKMASGGIYDHIGGGFARYSTDTAWKVPHFEKMLYDNGQLISLYSHAYQLTRNGWFKSVIDETIAFVETELTAPGNGFYSSVNADTEDGEGEFYAWSYDEFAGLVGDSIANYFNVVPEGNWVKKKNILFHLSDRQPPIDLSEARTVLLRERNKRTKPSVDSKILTSWNAMMLQGLVDAYAATGNRAYLNKALANAAFLEKNIYEPGGHLWRNYKDGKASINAFLDDYAWLAKAYIRLYQATFDKHWLTLALEVTNYSIANFYDNKSGFFYYTAQDGGGLVARKMEISDNAIPSSNAIMAGVLYNLGIYFENADFSAKSARMFQRLAGKIDGMASYYSQWCSVAGLFSYGTYEVAVMGKDADKKNLDLQLHYLPDCLFMGETDKENLPLLENKLVAGRTLIYVCTNRTCKLPVEDVNKAVKQIRKL